MAETTVAREFASELPGALDRMARDEWAVTALRERLAAAAAPEEAFASVLGALQVALDQEDVYAFVSCCWFALDLARRSGTTESPAGLLELLTAARLRARELKCEVEVLNVASWYRLAI